MILQEHHRKLIVSHALNDEPRECCGIIAAAVRGLVYKGLVSEQVYPMENVSAMPGALYEMDPQAQFEVLTEIEANGLELGAIYHSHPSIRAYPSGIDTKLAYWPETDYIIVGLTRQPIEVRSFRIVQETEDVEEEVEEVTGREELLQIVNSQSRRRFNWYTRDTGFRLRGDREAELA